MVDSQAAQASKSELAKKFEGWKKLSPVLDLPPELYEFVKHTGLLVMNIKLRENIWGCLFKKDVENYLIKLIEKHKREVEDGRA